MRSTKDDTLGGVTATKVIAANEEFVEDFDFAMPMHMVAGNSFQPLALAA